MAGGAQVGSVEIPVRSGFPKALLWCHQLTRGVCNNIVDILVKVWGFGVKIWFWTTLLAGKSANFFKSTTTDPFGVAIVLAGKQCSNNDKFVFF